MKNLRNKAYHWLRRSETFFKTDMVYLAKGSIWLMVGHVAAMLSGFFISIAFANLITKESYGTYKFVLSMIGIISAFSLTGIGTAVIQSAARGFARSLSRGFRINLRWSLGILVGGMALCVYYYTNGNMLLALAFLFAGLLYPISLSSGLYTAYLLGKKDFKTGSLYGTIANLVPAAAIIATLLLTQSVLAVIIVYFLSGALVPFLLYRATLRKYPDEGGGEDPELASYSQHLSAMGIIGQVANYVDKILIFHLLGSASLAIYAFAIAPVDQLQGGKKIFGSLIMPKLSGRPFEELQDSTPRKAAISILYAVSLIAMYIFLAPYFFTYIYPQYTDAIMYSQIYALTLLIVSGTVFNETLTAHKRTRELYLHRTIVPIVKIALFLILLPLFGLLGLILTHVINAVFSSALAYYFVRYPLKD